jgi:hypothetical protein
MATSGHAQLHELRNGDAHVEQTVSTVAEKPDWLDGSTEIELSTKHLKAYWDADILDVDDRNEHDTIIARKDPFLVRFRVYLRGRLWKCLCGNWCFDVCFTSIGDGPKFDLSDIVPDRSDFHIRDWKGCDGLYIEKYVWVPPETIPVEHCGTLCRSGRIRLRCCGYCERTARGRRRARSPGRVHVRLGRIRARCGSAPGPGPPS